MKQKKDKRILKKEKRKRKRAKNLNKPIKEPAKASGFTVTMLPSPVRTITKSVRTSSIVDISELENSKKLERAYISKIAGTMVELLENCKHQDEWVRAALIIKAIVTQDFNIRGILNSDLDIGLLTDEEKEELQESKELNPSERKILHNLCSGIILDEAMGNIDIKMNKLFFEVMKNVADVGAENRKINSINVLGGYNDILVKLDIVYGEGAEVYNPNDMNFIMVNYQSTDILYNEVQKLKTQFRGFSEGNLNRLANAIYMDNQLKSRKQGEELYSYDMNTMAYITVLESELKKMIKRRLNIELTDNIMLFKCIEFLKTNDFGLLSSDRLLDQLEFVRRIRNKTAHGEVIQKEDFNKVKEYLIDNQILELISFELR